MPTYHKKYYTINWSTQPIHATTSTKKKIAKSANSKKAKPKYYISKGIIWSIENHANAIQPLKPAKRDKNKIANNRATRRNFETLKIQTHKHKKEREKSQNRRGEKKTQSWLRAMESFKYSDCEMNRKGMEHLQIECPFRVGRRERVRSWTLLRCWRKTFLER